MAREIPLVMPKLSMTMETGELIEWTIAAGDEVSSGDVVATVQTDKVDMDIESPVTGTVARLVAQAGDTVQVGKPLAFISSDAEDLIGGLLEASSGDASNAPAEATTSAEPEFDVREPVPTPPSRNGSRPAVPFARRRAAELGLRLDQITGTGRNGLITIKDVEAQATSPTTDVAETWLASTRVDTDTSYTPVMASTTSDAAERRDEQHHEAGSAPGFSKALDSRRRSIRSAVARTMSASSLVPQFTVFAEIDLENLARERGAVGWTTLLVRALARALRTEPAVIAGWDEHSGSPASDPQSLGVALATDTAVGLLAPVIRDPDKADLPTLDADVRALIQRARNGQLGLQDMQGACTTLSNLGGFGVPRFTSLLTPPQASALSVGAITQRPVMLHGGLAIRTGVSVGLTVDHRAVDGADAARVLAELRRLCEQPQLLLS